MSPLHWLGAYETGDVELDAQHRAIVQALRDLEQLLTDRQYDGALIACRRLRTLLAHHSECEERRLAELNFPRIAEHIKLHGRFKREVGDLLLECDERCRRCAEVRCIERLTDAIVRGELIADVDYKSFLEGRRAG